MKTAIREALKEKMEMTTPAVRPPVRSTAPTFYRLPLSRELENELTLLAEARGITLEDFLTAQLTMYGKASPNSILISADEARSIQTTLGRNFQTGREGMARAIASLATVRIDGLEIQLPENLLQRLKSRCIHQPDFREWLRGTIITELQRYVGLR